MEGVFRGLANTVIVTHLMARSLETQASHMRARAEASVMQRV